jgi:predicted DNA-binding transcriptional regulator AlpA
MNNQTHQIVQLPQVMSREQLANYLGICSKSVYHLEKKGVFRPIKLGKRVVYLLDSVLEALDKLEKYEAPEPTTPATNP